MKKEIFYGWWIVAACFLLAFLFAGAGFYSFSIFINALGGALGTYASGLIYDYLGSYQYALYGFMASYLTATIAIFLAGKPDPYSRYK
jgi:hypothetical protein